MAKILKFTGLLLGGLLLLLLLAFILLITCVSPDRFKPILTEHVKKATGRELTIDGSLSWTFYPYLGLNIGHAALTNPAGFKQPTFVEFSHATLGVHILPLLHGQIVSKGITLSGMKLHLIKNAAGNANWNFKSSTASSSRATETQNSSGDTMMPVGVIVSGIDVTDAQVSWLDEQTKQSAEINDFALHATKINLTKPFPILMRFEFASKNPVVTGHVAFASQIAFSLEKNLYSLRNVDFKADIKQGQKALNPHVTGDLVADLSKDTVQWTNFKMEIANVTVDGKVSAAHITSSPETTGHLTVHPFDLKDFLKQTGQDNPSLQIANPVAGDLDFTTEAKTVTATGDLTIDQLQAAKLNMNHVRVRMHYLNGVIELSPLTANLYEGTMDAHIKLNSTGAQPHIALQGKLANVQSKPLLKDLSETKQKMTIAGVANVDFDLQTSGLSGDAMVGNLDGTTRVSFNNGVIEGIDLGYLIDSASALASQKKPSSSDTDKTTFGNLAATAVIRHGMLTNNDLVLNSPRFDTKGSGTINLVDQSINYSLQTSVKQTQISVVKELAGLTIPVRITGTLEKPIVRLDADALLKGVAKHEIEQRKDEIKQKIQEKIPAEAGKLLQNLLGR